jgi:hypothetical protein
MNIYAYRHLLGKQNLDSGMLGMLSCIVHRFPDPGKYHGKIFREQGVDSNFNLTVGEQYPATQVNIDMVYLAALQNRYYDASSPPNIHQQHGINLTLNPNGFVIFYVSSGTGRYSIEVSKQVTRNSVIAFDSHKLSEGDMFITIIIKPGTYSVTNTINRTSAIMVVSNPISRNAQYRPAEPISIDCTDDALVPNLINLEPMQGQIYRIKTKARIKIQ